MEKLLAHATVTLREIAEGVGLSYATLRAYSSGDRRPSPEATRKVTAYLRRRAQRVVALCDKLDAATERGT